MKFINLFSQFRLIHAPLAICLVITFSPLLILSEEPAKTEDKAKAGPSENVDKPAVKPIADNLDQKKAEDKKNELRMKAFDEEFHKIKQVIAAGKSYTEIIPLLRAAMFKEIQTLPINLENIGMYMKLAFNLPTATKSRIHQFSEVQKLFFDVANALPDYEDRVFFLAQFGPIPEKKIKEGYLYFGIQQQLKMLAILEAKYVPRKDLSPDANPLEPTRSDLILSLRVRAASGLFFIGKADMSIKLLTSNLAVLEASTEPRSDDRYFTNVLMIEPYLYLGQPSAALAAIERAEKYGPKISDTRFFTPIINYQKSNYYGTIGQFAKSDSFANQAITLARKLQEPYHQAYANRRKSQNQKRQKHYKAALDLALEAHSLYPDKGKLGEFLFVYEIASIYVALKDKPNWEIYLKKMQSMENDGPFAFKDLIAANKAYIEGDIAEAKKSLAVAESILGKTYPQCLELRNLGI